MVKIILLGKFLYKWKTGSIVWHTGSGLFHHIHLWILQPDTSWSHSCYFQLGSLLVCLAKQMMTQPHGPLPPPWDPRTEFWAPGFLQPSPSPVIWGVNKGKEGLSLSLILPLFLSLPLKSPLLSTSQTISCGKIFHIQGFYIHICFKSTIGWILVLHLTYASNPG